MRGSRDSRDASARKIVEDWLLAAKATPVQSADNFVKERRILEDLIPVNAAGFRGIVITALVGKMLNKHYDPTTDFYGCNPRSIFEKGIYYALVENGVPCGKSDPLNVAKNVQVIDRNWAKGRRPESAAFAAVEYIRLIQSNWDDEQYREALISLFFSRLWEYAEFCRSKDKPLAEFKGVAPISLALKLVDFVSAHPEGGATPQFVVGTLIHQLRLNDPDIASVEGVTESVFGTNTTSKKPADVWEVTASGEIGALYEITAKPVDRKRLDDCVGSLTAQELGGRVVNFICRLPGDIEGLGVTGRAILHGGVPFQFLDLNSFIVNVFCMLKPEQQKAVIELIDAFVKETNRKTSAKEGWGKLFG